MPWLPELFSAPEVARVLDHRRRDELLAVPYFVGLIDGRIEALRDSFAGEPEVHDPIRGRVKGARAFEAFMAGTRDRLMQRDVEVEDVGHVVTRERGFEEVVLHLDGEDGRFALPFAVVADRLPDRRIIELRLYHGQAHRPPLLQPDPELRLPDVVAEHQRALAADGVTLEACAIVDDGHTYALECNVAQPEPQAALAVHVRDAGGGLAAVRTYGLGNPARRAQPWKAA
jgi:hypothetical protein